MASNHCCRLGSECSVNRKVSKEIGVFNLLFTLPKRKYFLKIICGLEFICTFANLFKKSYAL